MQKKLKNKIKNFYNQNPDFITSPFTYTGKINKRGKDLFKNTILKNKKILEIGCGYGHIISYCQKKGGICYAMDLSEKAINIAKNNNKNIKYYVDDIENIKKLKEKEFDIIICLEVLEHTINYKETILKISKLLKKKGKLILSCPNYFNSCGLIKIISETIIGKNKWAPFNQWEKQVNENRITYFRLKKEIMKYFNIYNIQTIDISRGLFPIFYLNLKIEKNKIITKIRRFFEERRKYFIFKYFGSNIIINAKKCK